jgi:Zn-dependent M28 family amino/carboxypeptidase
MAAFIMLGLLLASMQGSLVTTSTAEIGKNDFTVWPEGNNAYDNMVQMTEFGYRKIDTSANENARNWIASQLESYGYEVERQPFTTGECSNCENIVVTIEGKKDKDWIVVGAHHDAICYTPPPAIGVTYVGCTSSGAYDDGTGSGSLLELARVFSQWNQTPEHTWKLAWWDYEEWQGTGSSEGGGMGSLHFVEQQIPDDVNVTYLNLDMFGLNWPVPTPLTSQLSGCDEDYWTLYMFTSPVNDWSYYEDRGLEVTDLMRDNAVRLQAQLIQANKELEHPTEWVRVIDDTKGNSDHYNFIINGYAATWLRGQHEYIHEEGDTCEQTPKHAQSDTVTTINTLAGGRINVESGLQTGLDVIATMAMWDRNGSTDTPEGITETQSNEISISSLMVLAAFLLMPLAIIPVIIYRRNRKVPSIE